MENHEIKITVFIIPSWMGPRVNTRSSFPSISSGTDSSRKKEEKMIRVTRSRRWKEMALHNWEELIEWNNIKLKSWWFLLRKTRTETLETVCGSRRSGRRTKVLSQSKFQLEHLQSSLEKTLWTVIWFEFFQPTEPPHRPAYSRSSSSLHSTY